MLGGAPTINAHSLISFPLFAPPAENHSGRGEALPVTREVGGGQNTTHVRRGRQGNKGRGVFS